MLSSGLGQICLITDWRTMFSHVSGYVWNQTLCNAQMLPDGLRPFLLDGRDVGKQQEWGDMRRKGSGETKGEGVATSRKRKAQMI